jgi:type II secretory pathway pseudopilin PulG
MQKMTNHSATADHNICGSRSHRSAAASRAVLVASRRSEAGYTLVALLAMMTVLALFAMAVAPSMQQQTMRDREQEAIFRGEQVADAIKAYYLYRRSQQIPPGDQALPTSMDQLLQGIPIPGGAKNRMILRVSAARDPLTIEGEWRFVLPRTEALVDFQQSILFYTNGAPLGSSDREMATLQQFAVPRPAPIIKDGTPPEKKTPSPFDDDATGPFVGVASRSKRDSVLTYYGIETHDGWIFTPLFR